MRKQIKDLYYYEWYLPDGSFLYGKEVYDFLMPRYRKARRLYYAIFSQLHHYQPSGNLVNDYLDLMEVMSIINIQIEELEEENTRL